MPPNKHKPRRHFANTRLANCLGGGLLDERVGRLDTVDLDNVEINKMPRKSDV